MKDTIKKTLGSGDKKYDVEVSFKGVEVETIQDHAMNYYGWKIQRTIRDADEAQREDWEKNGIALHVSEIGKPVVSTEKLVSQMSDEQALKALEALKARLNK